MSKPELRISWRDQAALFFFSFRSDENGSKGWLPVEEKEKQRISWSARRENWIHEEGPAAVNPRESQNLAKEISTRRNTDHK